MSADGRDERRVGGLSMGPNPVTAPGPEVHSENTQTVLTQLVVRLRSTQQMGTTTLGTLPNGLALPRDS